jgi:two-component system cell cycle response regulator
MHEHPLTAASAAGSPGFRLMRQHSSSHPLVLSASAVIGVGLAYELLRTATGVGGPALDSLTNNWIYMAVEVAAVCVCGARCLPHHEHRRAWGFMTLALTCWSVGDLLWAVWLDNLARPPFPSPADLSYLLMYPAMYAALMLMIRSRLKHAGASQWLDGGVMALAVGAVAAALVFADVLGPTTGRLDAEAVTVAYPVGDLILLMFVVLAFTLAQWRPGRDWLVLGTGLTLMAGADMVDVSRVARGIYVDGTLLNVLYLTSFSLLSAAAWVPSHTPPESTREAPHTILLTLTAAAIALTLLVVAAFTTIAPLAVGLAAGSLVLATARSALTYFENVRILRKMSGKAVTDSLTGLANRRQLIWDLEHASRDLDQATTLVFFDLNGFKHYNDTFGHLAGDALLARLASALSAAIEGHGTAYRLGGDEFTVLLAGRYRRHDRLITRATLTLTELGSGFDVTTAVGVAIMPDEAVTADAALRLADERMYADKRRAHRIPTRDVLMQLLTERTLGLLEHSGGVTSLTAAVGMELGLDAEQLDETLRAAELHDVGKLAVPDAILDKRGPLDPPEWEFMKQHPAIGARILSAAPAFAGIATLVCASHERWDGGGYPQGIAGEAIPLGARIVAVCDAFDAMTSERCYQPARSQADALAELRRNAGTQFDPGVVDAIERHLRSVPEPAIGATPTRTAHEAARSVDVSAP